MLPAAGFIGYAGNWASQGGNYAPIFSGQSLFDDVYYSSAAPAFESWPASYMQLADPAVFGDSEIVIQAPVDGEPLAELSEAPQSPKSRRRL